jgi:dynein heavy chain
MVYVFNCSDQMDYRVMAGIYKGLASSGCWGCFDEFNRITIEVLSVCSTQYKTVLDGIRALDGAVGGFFNFDDEDVQLFKTAMAFITMNPGYAGRTELPESLKALFRPVSMVTPDMVLITEIMLFSEGFKACSILARKFMLCYNLSMDLLSKADHYDWKLRAVKTTLCVAGSMKRAAPELSEDKVVLRAMRDFNVGKLLRDDVGIFMGLLNDLFPRTLELVPRARFEDFEARVRESAADAGYQADETFVLKISQLREIFQVRWSVFLLGPAGCGKTVVWQTSLDANIRSGEKGVANTLNPKGVTRNELYGYVSIATREWKDGLLSQIFRDFSNNANLVHEWIILDGDIDAEWIETMNTVMDDNKILTLVSGERIPLTPPMRLLFEIADLRNASPATVSRAGVIFINDDDIGWMPFVLTWLESRPDEKERELLLALVNKYVPKVLVGVLKFFKMTIPNVQINAVMVLCWLMDGLLGVDDKAKKGLSPEQLEHYFVFGCVWAFGGNLLTDKSKDHRKAFSTWWSDEFKAVKFPTDRLVFDYCLNPAADTLVPWSNEEYVHTPGLPVASLFVDIPETSRVHFIMDLLIPNHHYTMFVGGAGTGKTAMMNAKLRSLDEDDYVTANLAMNSMTDSLQLQAIMEMQLEKKAGIQFGPPGNKTLIYFIDDLNMPVVDKYGTQEPIALLRVFTDYKMWYEREKLTPRRVKSCDIAACMNPTAGSFIVDGRFQRQFATFSCQLPPASSLTIVFGSILTAHLDSFDPEVSEIGPILTAAASELQSSVANTFLPSAVKFHYIFNLRDIANVFGGLCRSEPRFYSDKFTLVQLYLHEAERVYRDRLISDADFRRFDDMHLEISKKHFSVLEGYEETLELRPNIFTSFCTNTGDDTAPWLPVKGWDQLKKQLEEQLAEHNETNAVMNLVLFTDAMEHVSRIARIVEQPRGNALLVGVGGSGKQSLARLAAFICQYEVYQITVTASYGVNAFKEDLIAMYKRAGLKSIGILWILTDQQIVDDTFLVFMNDMLASGNIPNLFPNEDIDDIVNGVRPEVKQAGIIDSKENSWEFYIEKVRKYLHVCLCFSPVGDTFRVRARQFPALVSCTQIDWFHAWSNEALVAVAARFLGDMDNLEPELKENLANHMAHVHGSVTLISEKYMESERRRNYVTPKSFLELIALYKLMLGKKLAAIVVLKEKLESGLEKLQATSEMVAELQEALVGEQAVVEEKKAATDALLVHVGQETQVAEGEKAGAAVEEEACAVIAAEVGVIQADAEKELLAAEPIIAAAEAALNSLDKGSLTELKAFGSPAEDVVKVTSCTLILTAGKPKVPKDISWAAAKKMMGNVGQFLDSLIAFDKDNVDEPLVAACEDKFLSDPAFEVENIRSKSGAAAGLCGWCINICLYFRIYQMVAPKRAMLAEANAKLDGANGKLSGIRARLAELDAQLQVLTDQFETATAEKNGAIAQAEKTQAKADLATRLVNGLSSEGVRWAQTIQDFEKEERTLIGDVMLASAFVSYIGSFTAAYRSELVDVKWLPDMTERQIPMTPGVTPIQVLTNEAEKAQWSNELLPSDSVSTENGAIICNSARWPLMIDPQLQGITWIAERCKEKNLRVVQLTTPKYLDQVEQCIVNGEPIIIENMAETIDAVLEPVISRSTIKKGRSLIIMLGDKEVDYDPNFQLYLQTKLSNPHYIPEVQAQCTMVNFTVTESGLEDQLLALVVGIERPDLEAQRADLIQAENDFKVQLSGLEANLLFRLANAEGDILEDIELIENLEETKRTSAEIAVKVAEGQETAKIINTAREVYRPVAARGSLHFFLVDKLNALAHMYQYSMANYVDILNKGIALTPQSADLSERIANMVDISCYTVFSYVASGLFERHKLVYAAQLCFKIQQARCVPHVARANTSRRIERVLTPRACHPGARSTRWPSSSCCARGRSRSTTPSRSGCRTTTGTP